MGAYYCATIKFVDEKNSKWFMYKPYSDGYKLKEHSYLGNDYVQSILNLLYNRKAKLVWLCDYHESESFNWDVIPEKKNWHCEQLKEPYLVANHVKKEFYSLTGVIKKVVQEIEVNKNTTYADVGEYQDRQGNSKCYIFIINPLPILINSDTEEMGGGDYDIETPVRASWKGDVIEVMNENKAKDLIKQGYVDVSSDVTLKITTENKNGENLKKYMNAYKKLIKQLKKTYPNAKDSVELLKNHYMSFAMATNLNNQMGNE